MKQSPRVGLLLAPLATPVTLAVWAVILGEDPKNKDSQWSALEWILMLGIFTLFSYVASIVLGVPLIRVLRRLNMLSIWLVVPAAAFLGAATLVVTITSIADRIVGPIWVPLAELAGAGAFLGILVAAPYCWIAGIGRRRA